ncbi:hypothetical protein [Azospirillum halopraeferens]|uniref:hypothetical protein n=1 Tax=Azospirillum halopraeferens TaxID=34010 RepID=UPI00040DD62D|nr:hypothetical protein [Azospirillum halopraeferens]
MTRDDFPYSLQPYATPSARDGAGDAEAWSVLLYRAAGHVERDWLRENGFALRGRIWMRGVADEGGNRRHTDRHVAA